MRLNFKQVELCNFLSYGHSTIELTNKGYCLVRGINNCKKDNTISNGSGKSTFVSAICWALTGETVQGVKQDIKNIYVEDNTCYVSLTFEANGKEYIITRHNKPKSDLKIVIDGEDKSGKGIKESELLLSTYLPDLNKDLITSVILLGQGLPNKLSSHSPSGRKELLEKLSKSDFMIEDIKSRLQKRVETLNKEFNEISSDMIALDTARKLVEGNIATLQGKLINDTPNFDEEIRALSVQINEVSQKIESNVKLLDELDKKRDVELANLYYVENERKEFLSEELHQYDEYKLTLNVEATKLELNINEVEKEINKINSIKDVCPTCGQKLIGVEKPDVTPFTTHLEELKEKHNDVLAKLQRALECHNANVENIKNLSASAIEDKQKEVNNIQARISSLAKDISNMENTHKECSIKRYNLEKDKETFFTIQSSIKEDIEKNNRELQTSINKLKQLEEDKISLQSHIDVVKKMDTLVKRDFRGFLLTNVFTFIEDRCKEYCNYVFGTNEFKFGIDGNDVVIEYCGKPFESLSGGEKQKVDLILQFAIRQMMSKYLDFTSNILVLDEIFDGLDRVGVTNVINMISNKLDDVESLFIISHHCDELDLPVDNELVIIKNNEGISEVK